MLWVNILQRIEYKLLAQWGFTKLPHQNFPNYFLIKLSYIRIIPQNRVHLYRNTQANNEGRSYKHFNLFFDKVEPHIYQSPFVCSWILK